MSIFCSLSLSLSITYGQNPPTHISQRGGRKEWNEVGEGDNGMACLLAARVGRVNDWLDQSWDPATTRSQKCILRIWGSIWDL
jgi:hypothetical protein